MPLIGYLTRHVFFAGYGVGTVGRVRFGCVSEFSPGFPARQLLTFLLLSTRPRLFLVNGSQVRVLPRDLFRCTSCRCWRPRFACPGASPFAHHFSPLSPRMSRWVRGLFAGFDPLSFGFVRF
jgi:hypothetical protein